MEAARSRAEDFYRFLADAIAKIPVESAPLVTPSALLSDTYERRLAWRRGYPIHEPGIVSQVDLARVYIGLPSQFRPSIAFQCEETNRDFLSLCVSCLVNGHYVDIETNAVEVLEWLHQQGARMEERGLVSELIQGFRYLRKEDAEGCLRYVLHCEGVVVQVPRFPSAPHPLETLAIPIIKECLMSRLVALGLCASKHSLYTKWAFLGIARLLLLVEK